MRCHLSIRSPRGGNGTSRKARSQKTGSRCIFERLESHGVGADECGAILRISEPDLPQSTLFFEQQFRDSTLQQVVLQTEQSRQLLAIDFILPEDQKKEIEKRISLSEMVAWNVLRDMSFPRLGAWLFPGFPLPTGLSRSARSC